MTNAQRRELDALLGRLQALHDSLVRDRDRACDGGKARFRNPARRVDTAVHELAKAQRYDDERLRA